MVVKKIRKTARKKRVKKKTTKASAVRRVANKPRKQAAEWSQRDVLAVTAVAVVLVLAVASFIGYVSIKAIAENAGGNTGYIISEEQAKAKTEKWISAVIKPGLGFEVVSVSRQPAYRIMVRITDPAANSSRIVPHLMTGDGKYLFTEGYQLK